MTIIIEYQHDNSIGSKDNPIYESEFGQLFKDSKKEDFRHLNQ